MFRKRKPTLTQKSAKRDTDPELGALRGALAERQEKIAGLELDLFNTRADLARFSAELEARLGPLQRRLEKLEAQLAEARRRASRRAQWGERADSPDLPEDVVTQYQRIWGHTDSSSPPPAPPPLDDAAEAEVKTLYRALAKRFHPDLTTDTDEKAWREQMMAGVNQAYAAQDLTALRALAAQPEPRPAVAAKTREQLIAELQTEIQRLDDLAGDLERALDELANTPAVELKLDAMWARRAGRDLLAEMAAELQADLARAERELVTLGEKPAG